MSFREIRNSIPLDIFREIIYQQKYQESTDKLFVLLGDKFTREEIEDVVGSLIDDQYMK